jgi:hypothetical protein
MGEAGRPSGRSTGREEKIICDNDAIGSGPPIPFGSGYQIRADEANLLIAVKR